MSGFFVTPGSPSTQWRLLLGEDPVQKTCVAGPFIRPWPQNAPHPHVGQIQLMPFAPHQLYSSSRPNLLCPCSWTLTTDCQSESCCEAQLKPGIRLTPPFD